MSGVTPRRDGTPTDHHAPVTRARLSRAQDERTVVAEALVAAGGVVSVQVLNELVAVARRKLGMTWEEVGEALGAIRTLCPSPVPIGVSFAIQTDGSSQDPRQPRV